MRIVFLTAATCSGLARILNTGFTDCFDSEDRFVELFHELAAAGESRL